MDQQPAPFSQPQPSGWNGYVIAIIICIVIVTLYYFISPHYQEIVEYIETMKSVSEMLFTLGSAFYSTDKDETTVQKEKPTQSTSVQKEKPTQNTQSTSVQKEKPTQNTQSPPVKEKPPTPTPKPDDSKSSIQSPGTAGYCYVGEWKGIRSCVKVDKSTPCKTNVYSTEELCVNPKLRP